PGPRCDPGRAAVLVAAGDGRVPPGTLAEADPLPGGAVDRGQLERRRVPVARPEALVAGGQVRAGAGVHVDVREAGRRPGAVVGRARGPDHAADNLDRDPGQLHARRADEAADRAERLAAGRARARRGGPLPADPAGGVVVAPAARGGVPT